MARSNPSDPRTFAYSLTQYGRNNTRWTRIGIAFTNKDGSINIELDALPLEGRIQLREETPDEVDQRLDRKADREEEGGQ